MIRPRRMLAVAVAVVALASLDRSAEAAVVAERTVDIELRGDDGLVEHSRLAVRMENEDDVASWSTYRIVLDENRILEALDAYVEDAAGRRRSVPDDDRQLHEYSGETVFYSSRRHLLVRFRTLSVGATLVVEQTVHYRPYYPASTVRLGSGAPTERLQVTVRGGDDAWRWHLDGGGEGLSIEPLPGGIRIAGEDLPARAPEALARSGARPILRFGWQRPGTWQDVGTWYRDLLAGFPRAEGALAKVLPAETSGPAGPTTLEALTAFAQHDVRYVAVEVGVGGYRPSPVGVTLARRWGDCKDKSLLLTTLLNQAGIEAYPALLRAGERERLDLAFASPDQFNHMIVAVADPAGGYRFVDPTQTAGGAAWLHPQTQGRPALVLRPEGAVLAPIPLAPDGERRHLQAEMTVDEAGDATGRVYLTLHGKPAVLLDAQTRDGGDGGRDEAARALLSSLLPGAALGDVVWTRETAAAPAIRIDAQVTWPGFVRVGAARPSVALPGMHVTPEPSVLVDRDAEALLPVRQAEASWRLTLPAGWCLETPMRRAVENRVGAFVQDVALVDGRLEVTRTASLATRIVEGPDLEALHAVALEEHRAHRRRIRLDLCRSAAGGGR